MSEKSEFYGRLDELNVEQMMTDLGLKADWEKIQLPKKISVGLEEGKHTFKATCNLKTDLNRLRKNDILGYYGHAELYDMYEAMDHYMTKEEVIKQFWDEEPNGDLDEGFVYPEIDTKNAKPLRDELVRERFLFMVYLAYCLAQEETMQELIRSFPKKKNGTFSKNLVMRIATGGLAKGPADLYQIYAKATSDTEIVISAGYRNLNPEEMEKVEEDYLNTNPGIFNLEEYL